MSKFLLKINQHNLPSLCYYIITNFGPNWLSECILLYRLNDKYVNYCIIRLYSLFYFCDCDNIASRNQIMRIDANGGFSTMYGLLIIIWVIALYIGISILLKKMFNINLLKRIPDIKLFQSFSFKVSRLFKNEALKPKSLLRDPLVHLFLYIMFLFVIAALSQWLLPENPPSQWISIIIILLGAAAIIIIPILFITSIVDFFIMSVETIPSDIKKLKQEKKFWIGLLIFVKIVFIMGTPSFSFSFIYGIGVFISNFPDLIGELITMDNFTYSMSVSFPIPIVESVDQEAAWWKFISFIQVILQRIIEIGVLGYIINIFHETFKSNDSSKNNNISSDEAN